MFSAVSSKDTCNGVVDVIGGDEFARIVKLSILRVLLLKEEGNCEQVCRRRRANEPFVELRASNVVKSWQRQLVAVATGSSPDVL